MRLAFGSCRYASPLSVTSDGRYGTDALDAYARVLAGTPDEDWPDGLMLLGDQVYADETSPLTQDTIRRRRDVSKPPGLQVANFAEYAELYNESWGDPLVRWLYATVPTAMIFDDHDIHDDWNTSRIWRERMQRTSWWQERITGGLAAYWVYQHLGNLVPGRAGRGRPLPEGVRGGRGRRAAAARLRRRRRPGGGRREGLPVELPAGLRAGADGGRSTRAAAGSSTTATGRWSAGPRRTGSSRKWTVPACDHLLVATSLPWLLPRAVHDLESWDEALCAGSRGRRMARFGEKLREAADLEHWAAFRRSFDWLAGVVEGVARPGPATVHLRRSACCPATCTTSTSPRRAGRSRCDSRVYQIVVSPVHHTVPISQRMVFRLGWSRVLETADHHPRQVGQGAAAAAVLVEDRRAVLRQRARHAGVRRAVRHASPCSGR